MRKVACFDSVSPDGPLEVRGREFPDLFAHVMQEGCAVVRGGFREGLLTELRAAVHSWGQATQLMPPQTYSDENYHSIESGISPRQKTPHVYHAYNFNRPHELHPALRSSLLAVFEKLNEFQNKLTTNTGRFVADAAGRRARPQIIHYPVGGGMFGKHTHPLEPQKIGLILSLSKRGVDFRTGSTHFEVGSTRFGTEDIHDLGDLILFRFDIPHWITAIDQGERFDPDSAAGRWTAVLPFY